MYLQGQMNVAPLLKDGHAYASVRDVMEALGYTVIWYSPWRQVIIELPQQ
jgi:hypothetical protein